MMQPSPRMQDENWPEQTTLKEAIIALFDGFSIEVTPREAQRIGDFRSYLEAGTAVYVTWLPGMEFSDTVHACSTLRSQGMSPVPHLAARALADSRHIAAILSRLRDEAGVDQALLIGGASKTPVGTFDCAMQVLETGLLQDYGVRKIGVAGHPEGSPDIGQQALQTALRQKNLFARDTNTEIYMVTQFFFDALPVIAWERDIRNEGNRLPIHAGLHGLASVTTLIRHARNCGIGRSVNVLMGQYQKLLKLASAKAPDRLVVDLARSRLADPESLIEKCHFFPFGSIERTVQWATALSRGEFRLIDGIEGPNIEC